MTDDIAARLRDQEEFGLLGVPGDHRCVSWGDAADEIERLRAALLEIFDHECRTSDRSFIACTARDALWPRAALREKKDG